VVERPGTSTVSAVMLHEIVRKLPDGALVTLADDGASGRLTVAAGRSNFSLATLPKEDFPEMTTSEYTVDFKVSAMALRRLFDKSKFAISTEETRYYLNGVYLHVAEGDGGEVLRCVATDGHRLARIDADLPENAKLMPTGKNQQGEVQMRYWSIEDYISQAGAGLERDGFFEVETHRVVEDYGTITHVFSTYDSRRNLNDEKPFARGINSIQLLKDDRRWYIMNVLWMGETKEFPLPEKYLSKKQ
jgi:hypothetical protein